MKVINRDTTVLNGAIPTRAVTRSARLATIPLAAAGRTALGVGKRCTGRSSEQVRTEFSQATAAHLLTVLGELKGGALKFGQALSVLEVALPDATAAPYRDALTKTHNAVPPMAWPTAQRVLADQFGLRWRERFTNFDPTPVAAASIGQVHRATWRDGRDVAVKIQYPGAGPALTADFKQLALFARLVGGVFPGLDVKSLVTEFAQRLTEELDYRLEAGHQRNFARAYKDDPNIAIPAVVASAPQVLVSGWLTGVPMSTIALSGSQSERDRAGSNLALLHFSSPRRCAALHADPHPGNFVVLADGRLGVLDFGAIAALPTGMPESLGRFTRLLVDSDGPAIEAAMRREGFIRPGVSIDVDQVVAFFGPIVEPLAVPAFQFSRDWLRGHVRRLTDSATGASRVVRSLNLPREYALIHRVTLGSLGMLCQLGATAPYGRLAKQWQPGFA